mgnify:FL=1
MHLRCDRFTLDFNSSIFTRYSQQEGAVKGYTPHKPGRASHYPLIAFVADSWMVANFWLRRGDAHAANNFYRFWKIRLPNSRTNEWVWFGWIMDFMIRRYSKPERSESYPIWWLPVFIAQSSGPFPVNGRG